MEFGCRTEFGLDFEIEFDLECITEQSSDRECEIEFDI